MPWVGTSFAFTEAAIERHAPRSPGVYAIWGTGGANETVYIGQADDLCRRLLEHRREVATCIADRAPTRCGFELVAREALSVRQAELIREYRPFCNR